MAGPSNTLGSPWPILAIRSCTKILETISAFFALPSFSFLPFPLLFFFSLRKSKVEEEEEYASNKVKNGGGWGRGVDSKEEVRPETEFSDPQAGIRRLTGIYVFRGFQEQLLGE
jgi:hypothetical protein